MDEPQRQEKSTGSTQNLLADADNESAQVKSTQTPNAASPVLNNAHTGAASLSSTKGVSGSQTLALLVMIGDYQALKAVCPDARMAAKDGKIYWSASISGHVLDLSSGILMIDGNTAADHLNGEI